MSPLELQLQKKLADRKEAGNLRTLKTPTAPVDLYSNDYLGLVTNGVIAQLLSKEYNNTPLATGSTGSRLLSGNSVAAEDLENNIAQFHHGEAALLFNSGYDANTGLLSSLADRHTTYIYDELCHASIIDGIRLAQTDKRYKYQHNDMDSLAEKLDKVTDGTAIVVTESIFSMDGDMAPLKEIAAMCTEHNASLIVDEAHATGVFGKYGAGLVAALGLEQDVFARVHTYGKAMGCHGATVVGSNALKQYLINFARSFIYTTALPEHSIKAIACAYQFISDNTQAQVLLHEVIAYFRKCTKEKQIKGLIDSESAIQALLVGENERTKNAAAKLQRAGFQINAILSPTVPAGSERLRICLHTYNTHQQIDELTDILATIHE